MEKQLMQLENGLKKLENKESKFYFLVQDTDGRALASVDVIYNFVKTLVENGYDAYVLYEKNEHKPVWEWLGEEFDSIPVASIESGELKVGPQDFVIIPELFGHVLEQIKDMPCTKLVLCQAYDYILETLNPGFGWVNYGVTKCITTSKSQEEYIKKLFPTIETTIIRPTFSEMFKPSKKPKTPLVTIHTRDPRDTMKIIKEFYLKNPQFKWVTFRDMRNMSKKDFAEALSEACVSVWVDRISGFGTFPIESMLSNTPVIGVLPIVQPDWINKENGLWVFDESKINDMLSNYLKNWLEDSLPPQIYEKMKETTDTFSTENEKKNLLNFFKKLVDDKIVDFKNSINKLTPVSENA